MPEQELDRIDITLYLFKSGYTLSLLRNEPVLEHKLQKNLFSKYKIDASFQGLPLIDREVPGKPNVIKWLGYCGVDPGDTQRVGGRDKIIEIVRENLKDCFSKEYVDSEIR